MRDARQRSGAYSDFAPSPPVRDVEGAFESPTGGFTLFLEQPNSQKDEDRERARYNCANYEHKVTIGAEVMADISFCADRHRY